MLGQAAGEGWPQAGALALAFVLSALIGLEREIRQKSAGLRTYTLVGFAAALIMLVSKYGFGDVLAPQRVQLDPSRIAAQIVSGIGFIGGGVIFVRQDVVRGLTTAATVWLTAAVGMACGAGLPLLAVIVTAGNFVVVFGFLAVEHRLPRSRLAGTILHISYQDERVSLQDLLAACIEQGFAVNRLHLERGEAAQRRGSRPASPKQESAPESAGRPGGGGLVKLMLEVSGRPAGPDLASRLTAIAGVVSVQTESAAITAE